MATLGDTSSAQSVTAAGLALLDDAAASDQRTTLGLGTLATQSGTFSGTSSGTNTGDQTNITGNAATVTTNANLTGPVTSVGNATTIADAELAALAGLTSAADKLPYFTGSGTAALADLSTFIRTLLDDAAAVNVRATLGLVLGTDVQAVSDEMAYRTGGTFEYTSATGLAPVNQAQVQDTLYAIPFFVRTSTSFATLRIAVGAGVASSSVRLGIYADASGVPAALLKDAGTVATTGTGNKDVAISGNITLARGWCWLACAVQGAAANLKSVGAGDNAAGVLATVDRFTTGPISGYSRTGVSSTLPDPWGATKTDTIRVPIVGIIPA